MPEWIVVSDYETHRATRSRAPFPAREVFLALLVCVAYYIGALIAQTLRFPLSHLSLLWPPTAIVMAALLLTPPQKWWLYLLAAAPAHVLVQIQGGVPAWGIVSQIVGNFGQALVAATTVRYVERERLRFDTLRGVIVFSLCAALFAPVLVSSIAAYLYVLSGWENDYW
jgi:integral membrane sensor domain MASE1